MSTILGRIRPVFRGEWDPETAYAALDMVRSADGQTSYTALKDVPAGTALSDAACWGKMVDMSSGAARPLPATAEGNPAQIWPDAGSALRPVTALAPLQSGSGDPSPDNVRPISGRTGVTITHSNEAESHEYTIALPETVYGGTLDWDTGVLTVTHKYREFDGTETWGMDSSGIWAGNNGNSFYTWLNGAELGISNDLITASSAYAPVRRGSTDDWKDNCVAIAGSGTAVEFIRTSYASVDDWKAYLAAQYAAGTPVQIVYRLATPTTIQLTPQQIAALPGLNTLFCDGDGLSVGYNKSIARMFEEVLALIPAASGE